MTEPLKWLDSRDFLDYFAHTETAPVKVNIGGIPCPVAGIGFEAATGTHVIVLGNGVSIVATAQGLSADVYAADESGCTCRHEGLPAMFHLRPCPMRDMVLIDDGEEKGEQQP